MADSFLTSLVVGVAYVFGMVAPLFVIALVWDGRNIGASRWLAGHQVRLRLAGRVRVVPVSSFAGGLLLVVMGVVVGVLAVTGPDMATRGWQATFSGDAQHYAQAATTWFGRLPGWVTALGVFAALAVLAALAVQQVADRPERDLATGLADQASGSCSHPADGLAGDISSAPTRTGGHVEVVPEAAGRPELAGKEGR
ncbi:MAG: hypothetical protein ACYCUG_05800 [Acidimicrobiales bacterium]